jgi:ribonuclease HI
MRSRKHTPFRDLSIHRDRDRDRDLRQETETGDRDRNRDKTETLRAPPKLVRKMKADQIIREVVDQGEVALALERSDLFEIFSDGACEPNPRPGAWAFVVYRNGTEEHSASGVDLDTTNNRMELTAALRALEWIGASGNATQASLQSDSDYVVKGCNEWRHRWKAKGWRKNGADIPNADLWRLLDAALEAQPLQLRWVRGHAGNIGNERADAVASEALAGEKG